MMLFCRCCNPACTSGSGRKANESIIPAKVLNYSSLLYLSPRPRFCIFLQVLYRKVNKINLHYGFVMSPLTYIWMINIMSLPVSDDRSNPGYASLAVLIWRPESLLVQSRSVSHWAVVHQGCFEDCRLRSL